MAFCFRCGTQIPDGAAFCSGCGTSQAPAQFPQQPAPQAQPTAPAPQAQPAPAVQPYYPPAQPAIPPQPAAPIPPAQPAAPIPQPQPAAPVPPAQPATVGQAQPFAAPAQPQPYYSPAAPVAQAAKAGGSMLKWLIPLLAVVVIGAGVLAYLYFCTNVFKSDEELIRERIQALEDAYNDGDWDGVLECLDNESRNAMEAYMGLIDGLMGEMGGLGMGMSDMFGFAGMMGDYCTIEIQDIQIDGDSALVTIVMTMDMYGTKQSEEGTFLMVKEDGDWYIGNMGETIKPGQTELTGFV